MQLLGGSLQDHLHLLLFLALALVSLVVRDLLVAQLVAIVRLVRLHDLFNFNQQII